MSAEFLKNNEKYAANFVEGNLPLPPAKKLLIVTCMDARIDVYESLGIHLGEAHTVRNAGGSARDALRSIVISQRLLGTREIAVFHHTGCGMLTFTTQELREKLKKETPGAEAAKAADTIDFFEFSELETSIKDDVKFLQEHPLILKETKITGWVYHIENGKVSQVV